MDEPYILLPQNLFDELVEVAAELEKTLDGKEEADEKAKNAKVRRKLSVIAKATVRKVVYVLSPSERRRYCNIGEYLFSAGADVVEKVQKEEKWRLKMRTRILNAMTAVKTKFDGMKKFVFDNPLGSYIKRIMVAVLLFFMNFKGIRNTLMGVFHFFSSITWKGVKKVYHWITDFFTGRWQGIKNRMKKLWKSISKFYDEMTSDDEGSEESTDDENDHYDRIRNGIRDVFRKLRVKIYELMNNTRVSDLPSAQDFRVRNLGYIAEVSQESAGGEGELDVRLGTKNYRGDAVLLLGESALQGLLNGENGDEESAIMGKTVVAGKEIPVYHKVLGNDIDWSDETSVQTAMAAIQGKVQKTIAEAFGTEVFDPDSLTDITRAISQNLTNPNYVLSDQVKGIVDAFGVDPNDRAQMESLFRVINASASQWGVEGQERLEEAQSEIDNDEEEGQTIFQSIINMAKSLYNEAQTTMEKFNAAVYASFEAIPLVTDIRKEEETLPEKLFVMWDKDVAEAFKDTKTALPERQEKSTVEIDTKTGIAVVENHSKYENKGLKDLLTRLKDSNSKRMVFLTEVNKLVAELERRLSNG